VVFAALDHRLTSCDAFGIVGAPSDERGVDGMDGMDSVDGSGKRRGAAYSRLASVHRF
jgi:hypothetical protein